MKHLVLVTLHGWVTISIEQDKWNWWHWIQYIVPWSQMEQNQVILTWCGSHRWRNCISILFHGSSQMSHGQAQCGGHIQLNLSLPKSSRIVSTKSNFTQCDLSSSTILHTAKWVEWRLWRHSQLHIHFWPFTPDCKWSDPVSNCNESQRLSFQVSDSEFRCKSWKWLGMIWSG